MSFIIRIPGADFSGSGLPKLKRSVRGFNADGLAGLWLAEDGVLGQAITSINDLSGNEKTATLMAGFDAPTKSATGIQSAIGDRTDFIFDTGVQLTANHTVIFAGQSKTDPSTTNAWEMFLSDTGSDIPTSKTDAGQNGQRPSIGVRLDQDTNTFAENILVMDRSGLYQPSYIKVNPTSNFGKGTEPLIVAQAFDDQGDYQFKTYTGFDAAHEGAAPSPTDAQSLFAGAGNLCFGHWLVNTTSNPSMQGALYGCAVYNRRLTSEEMNAAMQAMATELTARGVAL